MLPAGSVRHYVVLDFSGDSSWILKSMGFATASARRHIAAGVDTGKCRRRADGMVLIPDGGDDRNDIFRSCVKAFVSQRNPQAGHTIRDRILSELNIVRGLRQAFVACGGSFFFSY